MGEEMSTKEITNFEDIIDSRDVIARIQYLEGLGEDGMDEDELQELESLKKLAKEGESCADWSYGETLIRDSYFVTYAQELAEDIGALENCNNWPATCIDWDRAARELQYDYSRITFDGVDYWVRS